ncbi:MAG TPA: Fic family protein [Candidatus Woesebacteria bacterium]|nr:Fic family protein [Candidatus Woesebacteria bacterium]
MFIPKYQLTSSLLTNLTTIERLYGQLEALRIPQKLELNLERDNLVKSSYISNSIEGNPLSLPEVTNLLLNERVPANKDEKEVKNYFDILKSLGEYSDQPVSLHIIQALHARLMQGADDDIAGKIRNSKVVIGGYNTNNGVPQLKVKHEPPFHSQQQIQTALQEVIAWHDHDSTTPAILKIGIFHHQYVYIHPFADGNGRTCRLLIALLLLKNNYQINKYFVLDDYYDIDRSQYSDKLSTADKGDKTEWLEYFSDGMKYSLQSALGRVSTTIKSMNVEDRPTGKEQLVLDLFQIHQQITSADIAARFKVSRQQAHKLLSGLVEKGFVKKKGDTKSSYYLLK